jgi:hypothetical protein
MVYAEGTNADLNRPLVMNDAYQFPLTFVFFKTHRGFYAIGHSCIPNKTVLVFTFSPFSGVVNMDNRRARVGAWHLP